MSDPVGAGDGWLWLLPLEVHDPAEAAAVPTTLPCPDWCELPAGHEFDNLTPGRRLALVTDSSPAPQRRLLRVHRQRFGAKPTHVALEAYERTANGAGPSDLDAEAPASLVRVQFPHACGYLTPAGARRLAALLLEAAVTSDTIGRTTRGDNA